MNCNGFTSFIHFKGFTFCVKSNSDPRKALAVYKEPQYLFKHVSRSVTSHNKIDTARTITTSSLDKTKSYPKPLASYNQVPHFLPHFGFTVTTTLIHSLSQILQARSNEEEWGEHRHLVEKGDRKHLQLLQVKLFLQWCSFSPHPQWIS